MRYCEAIIVIIPPSGLRTQSPLLEKREAVEVIIPPSGLRTLYPRNVYHVYYESSSHPVGLEPKRESLVGWPDPCHHPTQWA